MKIVEELYNNIIKVMFYNGGLYPCTYYITTKGKIEDEIFSEKLAMVIDYLLKVINIYILEKVY